MGEHARRIQERLAEGLAAARPDTEWTVEHRVGGTPVDVVGITEERLVLVELEWRRADPADNAAKLFRHLAEESGALEDAGSPRDAVVVQLFTAYYDLASGGVSSKRKNAVFVGRAAAGHLDRVAYRPVELPLDPPKRGGDLPADWAEAADATVDAVVEAVEAIEDGRTNRDGEASAE